MYGGVVIVKKDRVLRGREGSKGRGREGMEGEGCWTLESNLQCWPCTTHLLRRPCPTPNRRQNPPIVALVPLKIEGMPVLTCHSSTEWHNTGATMMKFLGTTLPGPHCCVAERTFSCKPNKQPHIAQKLCITLSSNQ